MAHIVGGLGHVICVAKIVTYMHCVRKSIYNPPFIYLKRTVNQPFLELSHLSLTLSRRRPLSYRNQSIDLLCKPMDWFLYDNGLRHQIFGKCVHSQISDYFEIIFSKFQCHFRKGYSTQDCLLTRVETCKKAADQGKEYRLLLTDISKAFDCLAHDLLMAERHLHGCSIESLNLNDYQRNASKVLK